MRKMSRNVWWLCSNEENAQSKFNPSSYVETCLHASAFILTSLLLKKPSIWMPKLAIYWVIYKARLHEKQIYGWSVQIHHVITFKGCGGLGLPSLSTSMSVQHRELLGLSQFFEMMVRHNVIPGMQTNWTKDLLVHSGSGIWFLRMIPSMLTLAHKFCFKILFS